MKERILIVDDDVDFVQSTSDLLEAHGYRVISAHDGESGLEMARRERPDLMVLDVMMATKTEGFEIARRIPNCPELRSMPVLLVTGVRSEMKLGFRLEPNETWLPVSRIMEKPIDPAGFVASVAELLRARNVAGSKHNIDRTVGVLLAEKSSELRTVSPDDTVFQAVLVMEKYRVGSVLVIQSGKLVGICTERDCVRRLIVHDRPMKTTRIRDVMTPKLVCVSPDDTITDCMSIMTHQRIRHLPVLDGEKLVGIVSIGDIIRSVLAQKDAMIDQLESYIATG